MRQALHGKVQGLMNDHLAVDNLPPAQASKLVGSVGFAMQAAYGRVRQAALAPLWQRMHTDVSPWNLSLSLRWSFEFLAVIMAERPRRVVLLFKGEVLPLLVASDAQAEFEFPSGGCLAPDPESGARTGGWCVIARSHLEARGFTEPGMQAGENPIQCCETAMLPWAVLHLGPKLLKGRRVCGS